MVYAVYAVAARGADRFVRAFSSFEEAEAFAVAMNGRDAAHDYRVAAEML